MNKTLHLTITTPAQILAASDNVVAVRVEDQSGSFGVLPGHADLLTALVPSVVRWRTLDGAACFCAVRGGVFAVSGGRNVSVACREGDICGLIQLPPHGSSGRLHRDRRPHHHTPARGGI